MFIPFLAWADLEFFSSDAEKAHGPRRDVLFLNEAQNISFSEADQLIVRTRKIVWMDWMSFNFISNFCHVIKIVVIIDSAG